MDQIEQLKEIRRSAKARLELVREGIKSQLLALENSADARLVRSLGQLIAELESAQATTTASTTGEQTTAAVAAAGTTKSHTIEDLAEDALAEALSSEGHTDVSVPEAVQKQPETLSALAEKIRNDAATGQQ